MQIYALLLAKEIKYEHASIPIYWHIAVPNSVMKTGTKLVFAYLKRVEYILLGF
jgi:hypothetical protein